MVLQFMTDIPGVLFSSGGVSVIGTNKTDKREWTQSLKLIWE
jgi:hypothetical protein